MCDEWMPVVRLPLTLEQYRQLPRNAAYHYEYVAGHAVLSPSPKHYHAVLDLGSFTEEPPAGCDQVHIRSLAVSDWEKLPSPFAAAFARVQPFASLAAETLQESARACLERTRSAKDGPLLNAASFVAELAGGGQRELCGAILVTLIPGGDPTERDSYYWPEANPAQWPEASSGQPHLTWIFVAPPELGRGIGSALLAAAVRALREIGIPQLWSTFLHANESTMLWHWRNGFRLLPYPRSRRLFRALER